MSSWTLLADSESEVLAMSAVLLLLLQSPCGEALTGLLAPLDGLGHELSRLESRGLAGGDDGDDERQQSCWLWLECPSSPW